MPIAPTRPAELSPLGGEGPREPSERRGALEFDPAAGRELGDDFAPTLFVANESGDPFDDFEEDDFDDEFDDDFEEDWEDDLTEDEQFPDTFGGEEEPDGDEEESPFSDDPDFDDE